MAVEIKMPQLSDTMESGKILVWHKQEGDAVARGDILAEVETDKANLEIESFHEGVLLKINVDLNEDIAVGTTIAIVGAAGESVEVTPTPQPEARKESNPEPAPEEAEPTREPSSAAPNPSEPRIKSDGERLRVSPLARSYAREHSIDLNLIKGSGPHGRIVKRDVEQARSHVGLDPEKRGPTVPAAPSREPAPAKSPPLEGQVSELSRIRSTIARRMEESMRDTPHFYSQVSVKMRAAMALYKALREHSEYQGISINHLVIKAAGYALAREPRVNCSYRDGKLYDPGAINVGIITAIDDGLLIPVIKNVNALPMRDLVFESRTAVERIRAGRPSANDLSGGTFSISNLGMFGVESFTAIINPGQGAVLAVGTVQDTPVADQGTLTVEPVMQVTLSVDHRIIDGVVAARFLAEFRKALEVPGLLFA